MKVNLETNFVKQVKNYSVITQRLLFFFLNKLVDENKQILVIPVKEIKSFIPGSNKNFESALLNQLRIISTFRLEYSGSLVMNKEYVSGISLANFFSTIAYVPDPKNPKIKLVLNNASYARLNLIKNLLARQFRQTNFLRSKYARRMEQIMLKSDKTEKTYTLDELFDALDIPASYKRKASHMNEIILVRMQNELKQLYSDFKVTPIKSPHRGRQIIGYKISWKKDKPLDTQLKLPINKTGSQAFNNQFKRRRKNRKKIIQRETIPDWDAETKKHQKSPAEHKRIRKEIKKNLAELNSMIDKRNNN